MRSSLRILRALLLLAPVLVSGAAADDVCDVRGAPRIVAVGDVHGAYDNFVEVLRMAGIVDDEVRWAGGQTHFVQTGDLLDRGAETRKVLDLMMRLEKEAKKAGGQVHALLGNHEVMNMLGDLRYVDPEEYESFRTDESEALRDALIDQIVERNRERAKEEREARAEAGEEPGEEFDEAALRARLEKEAPPGFVERTRLLSDKGEYGKWLRKRNAVVRINGIVFLHGGISPEVAPLGCEGINERVRREITKDFSTTRQDAKSTLVAGADGPLWYRGLAKEDEILFAPALDQILKDMAARAIVVGHTVTVTGRIQARFGGRVVMIDAGMAPAYRGALAALEVDAEGRMTAVYPDDREVIEVVEPAAAAAATPAPRFLPAPAGAR
jgi:hypothetical protein